ncbi:MAG: T9SS type A sorting domain-containing protein [Chitinophagales bacterium]|nr:T9SS type A sorting domain-containing protein [Chitinophagales bacterium]
MKLRHSLFFFIFTCYSFWASASEAAFSPEKVENDTCTLSAPFNFHVKGIGPDWALFAWQVASPNIQHRIRLYRASDTLLLSTTIVPSGVGEVNIPIPPMTDVFAVANAICTNGIHSENISSTFPIHGIILDLIVIGYQGSSNAPNCSFMMNGGSGCPFGNSGKFTFRVTLSGKKSKQFEIERVSPDEELYHITQEPGNNLFNFYCGNGTPTGCPNPWITIKYLLNGVEVPAANLTVNDLTQTNPTLTGITFMIGNEPVVIQRLTPFGLDKPDYSSSRALESPDNISTLSPNPFSNELTISFEQTLETPQTIQLFSSEGRLTLQETIPANQSSHTLSTAHLAPGFYFLRIEADGNVQTFKVIKSAQ